MKAFGILLGFILAAVAVIYLIGAAAVAVFIHPLLWVQIIAFLFVNLAVAAITLLVVVLGIGAKGVLPGDDDASNNN